MAKLPRRIDEGWYQDDEGTVYQRWWAAQDAPRRCAGWYVWTSCGLVKDWTGPYRTLREARRVRSVLVEMTSSMTNRR